ncbi:Lysosomal alpha-mannosidase [Schistosoma japonicum]|uniref:Lysosomal alpha-mannosidase n=1 Tax=Schistosoma japonicum TaxID=6182 RepID=A0A4Z2D866_SCHJA|nr:Lysosomal alpha-mannosidase [Schistosoma japonicum]
MSLKCNFMNRQHLTIINIITILLITIVYMHQIDGKNFRKLLKYFTSSKCGYESCDLGKPGYLNVHLIPHTHDDVGWLKTVDQYYYGTNNTIQRAGVQYILDSVISALAYHPERKFTFVEIVYFYQWWIVQSEQIKHLVKDLVQSGQLQFALGGWTMADEASVYYSDAIDQLTRGRDVLKQLFGDCGLPLVAWQIDPFGHSHDYSNLLQDAGYDAVYFQRIDYREKEKRKEMKELEILWDTTTMTFNTTSKHEISSINKTSINNGLFTGIFYDTYCYPNGFEYDDKFILNSIVDNPLIQEYNVDSVVKGFINYVKKISKVYQTNHVMVLMGCDFTYESAHINYNNMDKLIKYVNEQQKLNGSQVNLLYSTPACYTKAVNDAFNQIGTITRRGGDFFPYASGPYSYWTGYYTSRPALKYYVRQASNLLAMCEHIHLFANHISTNSEQNIKEEQIDSLRNVLGILQHHDAITGTAKQHVTNDYAWRLSMATKSCQTLINQSYTKLLPDLEKYHSNVRFCDLLNISLCNTTENYQSILQQSSNNKNDGIFILLYNPLGWEQSNAWIRFPIYIPYENDNVNSSNNFKIIIKDLSNNLTSQQSLPYQLKLIDNRTLHIPERKSSLHKANYEVLFNPTSLLPIGFKLFYFFIDRASSSSSGPSTTSSLLSTPLKDSVSCAKTMHLQLFYNEVNNTIEVITKHIKSGIELRLRIELLYYEGETQPPQPSGAYVFLPKRNSSVLKFNSSQEK